MAMKKFEPVQRGWAGNADAAQEEKARWKTVMAQVSEHRKKMATILLSDPRAAHTPTAAIIEACNIGHTPEGTTPTGRQALYAAGMTEAAHLLKKPARSVPEAFPATAREFHLDPALYAAGADMVKSLQPFMVPGRQGLNRLPAQSRHCAVKCDHSFHRHQ
jgi:hypothetical protein